jgi:hypothetical protein
MKIWNSFGSAHSSNITIIGEFKEGTKIDLAEQIIEDFANASIEQRYKTVQDFCNAWKERTNSNIIPNCPDDSEFQTGINDPCQVVRDEKKITVSKFSTHNIGGIIKLMLMFDPVEIRITEPPKR